MWPKQSKINFEIIFHTIIVSLISFFHRAFRHFNSWDENKSKAHFYILVANLLCDGKKTRIGEKVAHNLAHVLLDKVYI